MLCLGGLAIGCGGNDGASQEELDRAREEGAKAEKEKATMDDLQRQVKRLQRQQERQPSPDSGGSVSPAPTTAPTTSPAKYCADGIGASSATSCDFAMNVTGEYGSNPGTSSLEAYSPATGQYYMMSCVGMSGWAAVCTGGNNAAVYIP